MSAFARQSTCVAVAGRGILIEGPPGCGKSSLALALIDRRAVLVGDDSVMLEACGESLVARPHPQTRGLLEVRNLGLLPFPCMESAPVALVIALDPQAPRYIETAEHLTIADLPIPMLRLHPDAATLPLKAELALRHYGLGAKGD